MLSVVVIIERITPCSHQSLRVIDEQFQYILLLTLRLLQLAEYTTHGINPLKLQKQQLFSFLKGNFYFSL